MLWNWTTIDACFLASSWQIKSQGMMAASCIGVALLVVVLECLRRLGREYDNLIIGQMQRRGDYLNANSAEVDNNCTPCHSNGFRFKASPLQQLVRAIIHAVTFGVGYIIMLLAMYFNGYIIISIVIGAALGKYFADWLVVDVLPVPQDTPSAKGIEETTVCCG